MTSLAQHIHQATLGTLEQIPADELPDIYVLSLFMYDEDDDPRLPTVTVGFNTEGDFSAAAGDPWSDDEEARWNFAFWRQNELAVICGSKADPDGARLREAWARESGSWFELTDGETATFNERGKPLTKAFVELLIGVVQQLHQDGDVRRIFGRPVPLLIHELEYYDAIAEQNLAANPSGVVPDGFVRWCRGE